MVRGREGMYGHCLVRLDLNSPSYLFSSYGFQEMGLFLYKFQLELWIRIEKGRDKFVSDCEIG